MASSRSAACTAPSDYQDLFLEYGTEIKRMVWRHLGLSAHREDVEDGLQYIFQQFVKNNVLEQYSSEYISEFTGQPVKFRAFILAKVPLYCRGLREAVNRRSGRELLVLDTPAGDSGDTSAGELGGLLSVSDEYPSLAGSDTLDWLRAQLADRAPSPGRLPVLSLFDALAGRFSDGKSVSADAVRSQFGMTEDEAEAWFAELKDALREATAHRPAEVRAPAPVVPDWVPLTPATPAPALPACEPETAAWFAELRATADGGFALGGLVLSAAEVRAAADALKGTRGNQVLRAFKNAGHRLAGAGKTWYLDFAETVMQAYPELRTPPQRHADGHFGRVKQALIFGLERLADSASAESAAEPVLPADDRALWAELESVLARMPGFDPENVEAALEAVRLLALAPA